MGKGAKGTELEGGKLWGERKRDQRRERLKEEQQGEKLLPKEVRTGEGGRDGGVEERLTSRRVEK